MLIDRDRERQSPMISPHHLLKESFCRGNVAFCREHELDRVAFFIQGAIEILPLLADLHLCFVNAVGGASHF